MSDINEREDDFNAWYIRQNESTRDFDVMRMAWQARGELEAKKLEDAYKTGAEQTMDAVAFGQVMVKKYSDVCQELAKIKNVAACGTSENFLKCNDETKRNYFAMAVIDSSNVKDLTLKLEASDARYQARIKELEEAAAKVFNSPYAEAGFDFIEAMAKLKKTLSPTSPDTALQRKVLEARIDECEASMIQYKGDDPVAEIYKRVIELRAQLAALK